MCAKRHRLEAATIVVVSGSDTMDNRIINQMGGLLRNSFLHLACLGLLILPLAGCAGKQAAAPPAPPSTCEVPRREQGQILPLVGYSIQAGAFAKVDNAYRLTATLLARGLPAYYFRGEADLYRVRFGNYQSYEAAQAGACQLRRDGVIDVYAVIRPESYPVVRLRGQEAALRRQVVTVARQFVGVPYQWGDATPVQGFDCSGLTMMVYQLVGLDMPRISKDQFRRGQEVAAEHLQAGDLVFFTTDSRGQASHVGIYLGDGQFLHAPRRGKTVTTANLSSDYFQKRYLGARRYL